MSRQFDPNSKDLNTAAKLALVVIIVAGVVVTISTLSAIF